MKEFKNKGEEIGIVWVLKSSGAALEGFSISHTGKEERNAQDDFSKLLNKLQFSDEAKKIFMTDGGYRFNALKEPMEFIRKIHNIPVVNFMNGRKVIENYYEENWYVKFYELKDLLHLWRKRTEKNKEIKGEIDFGKYWEPVTLFLKV